MYLLYFRRLFSMRTERIHVNRRRTTHTALALFGAVLVLLLAISSLLRPVHAAGPRLTHPSFVKNNAGSDSILYAQNLDSSSTTLQTQFVNILGSPASDSSSIPATGTLVLPAADVSGLPDGAASILVNSDGTSNVRSVVRTVPATPTNGQDGHTITAGTDTSAAQSTFHLGPVDMSSAILLQNPTSAAATISLTYLNSDGTTAVTSMQSLSPGGSQSVILSTVSSLPSDYQGMVRIASDQPLLGWLALLSPVGFIPPLAYDSTEVYVPRLLRSVDEGGGPRTSTLFLGNITGSATNVTVTYYSDAGTNVTSETITIPANGSTRIDTGSVAGLSDGTTYTAQVSSVQSLFVSELTRYDGATTYRSNLDTYIPTITADTTLALPYIANTDDSYTVLYLHNQDNSTAANATVTYTNPDGTTAYQATSISVPPLGVVGINQRDLETELGTSFVGSATITASEPLLALVDEYLPGSASSVVAPASVSLASNVPTTPGVGTSYSFTATVAGSPTTPLDYTWEATGLTPVTNSGGITDTVNFAWDSPGEKTVTVTAGNSAGSVSQSVTVTIVGGNTVTENLDGSSEVTVDLNSSDTGERFLRITFPAASVSEAIAVLITELLQLTEALPADLNGTGYAFVIEVAGETDYQFDAPVAVTISYDPAMVENPARLALYRYDTATGTWQEVNSAASTRVTLAAETDSVSFAIPRTGTYAMVERVGDTSLYLPLVQR
jgi:hypothetical protein